jgi:hypothetical protein
MCSVRIPNRSVSGINLNYCSAIGPNTFSDGDKIARMSRKFNSLIVGLESHVADLHLIGPVSECGGYYAGITRNQCQSDMFSH